MNQQDTEQKAAYLGDGVYARFDGYHIWLSLDAQDPNTRIALEPEVFQALIRYSKLVAIPEVEDLSS